MYSRGRSSLNSHRYRHHHLRPVEARTVAPGLTHLGMSTARPWNRSMPQHEKAGNDVATGANNVTSAQPRRYLSHRPADRSHRATTQANQFKASLFSTRDHCPLSCFSALAERPRRSRGASALRLSGPRSPLLLSLSPQTLHSHTADCLLGNTRITLRPLVLERLGGGL